MEHSRVTIRALMALCIILALAVAALGIAWGVTADRAQAEAEATRTELENGYRQQYYQLCYNIGNLSDYLNKLLVASSPTMQMQLLGQINVEAASAGASLNGLVAGSEQAAKTTRYINQVGDYCLRLQYALAQGGRLTADDRDNLVALYTVLTQMETRLEDVKSRVDEGNFSFLSDAEDNVFAVTMASFEAEAVAYPALIYDGPFSDALVEATPQGLTGQTVGRTEAEAMVATYLPTQYTLSYLGELGGKIECYRYEAQTAYGTYWLDITKQGGHLLTMSSDATPQDSVYSAEQCAEYGLAYLHAIGLDGMQAVWASNYNSVYYINYAYTVDDVVCYSDLIILKINAETRTLVGVEARNYWMNHRERQMDAPAITAAEARAAVHQNLEVDSVRLALIPTDGGQERLTYELAGKSAEDRYFVYVDAASGSECKILRVIDSQEGQLLQ